MHIHRFAVGEIVVVHDLPINDHQPEYTMPDSKKLARFLVSSSSSGGDPELVIELDDGSRLALTASFEQIEDMADVLDRILDAVGPDEGGDADRLPAFVRRSSSAP